MSYDLMFGRNRAVKPMTRITKSGRASKKYRGESKPIDIDLLKQRLLHEQARILVRDARPAHLAAALELAAAGQGGFCWDHRLHGRVFVAGANNAGVLTPDAVVPGERTADESAVPPTDGKNAHDWREVYAAALVIVAERRTARDAEQLPPHNPDAAWQARMAAVKARQHDAA